MVARVSHAEQLSVFPNSGMDTMLLVARDTRDRAVRLSVELTIAAVRGLAAVYISGIVAHADRTVVLLNARRLVHEATAGMGLRLGFSLVAATAPDVLLVSLGVDTYKDLPYTKDADFHNYGAFSELTWYAADRDRVITGARLDRASAKDYRQSIGSGMSTRPKPTPHGTPARS